MTDTERLFFALWPTPEQQGEWAALAQELLPKGCGRLIPSHNLHITLLYLGEIGAELRQTLEQGAEAIHLPAFELKLERFGYWRRPQVVWWGVRETPEPLTQLVDALRRNAAAAGLEVDRRPYVAHLTLARKVRRGPGRLKAPASLWSIKEFALVRSTLLPEGAQYEALRRWPLQV